MKLKNCTNVIVLLLGSFLVGGCDAPDTEGLFDPTAPTGGTGSAPGSSSSGRVIASSGVIGTGTGSATTSSTISSTSSSSTGTGGSGGAVSATGGGGSTSTTSTSSSSSSGTGGTGGTGGSVGTGGGSETDGGADADAGPSCNAGDFSCAMNGVTPLICNGSGQWIPNGGDCNFGCNGPTGVCNCSAGPNRYTMDPVDGCFTDTVTNTKFYVGIQAPSAAQAVCPNSSTLATMTQLQTLLAQQVPAAECLSPDVDPALGFVANQGTSGGKVSSKTPCAGGLLTLDLQNGTTSCVSATSYNFLCVQ